MLKKQTITKVIVSVFVLLALGLTLPINVSARETGVITKSPRVSTLDQPRVDTLNDPRISPFEIEKKYTADVSDALIGFGILIVAGAIIITAVNFKNKKQLTDKITK